MRKLLLAALLLSLSASAGTLTITTDTATDTDVQAWCQAYAGMATAPTQAQVKANCVIPLITNAVRSYKLTQSMNAITPYAPSQMN